MPKYIDADALIKTESELLELRGLTDAEKTAHLFALSILTTAKPADVAPVRRTTYKYFNGFDVPRCVNCRCGINTDWLYCPSCGAVIDYDAPECGDRVDD